MTRNLIAAAAVFAATGAAAAQPRPGYAFYQVGTTADPRPPESREYWTRMYARYEAAKAAGTDPAQLLAGALGRSAPAPRPLLAPGTGTFGITPGLSFGPPRGP